MRGFSIDPSENCERITEPSDAAMRERLGEKDKVKVALLTDALKRIAFEPIPNEVPDSDAARWLATYAKNALEQVEW